MDEVRSGGSYISQSDLRIHFGIGKATTAEIEIRWPSGTVDRFVAKSGRILIIREGVGANPPPFG